MIKQTKVSFFFVQKVVKLCRRNTDSCVSTHTAAVNEYITHLQSASVVDSAVNSMYMPKAVDNIDIVRQPIHAGYDFGFVFSLLFSFPDAWHFRELDENFVYNFMTSFIHSFMCWAIWQWFCMTLKLYFNHHIILQMIVNYYHRMVTLHHNIFNSPNASIYNIWRMNNSNIKIHPTLIYSKIYNILKTASRFVMKHYTILCNKQ